jgi:hypothetical protein
MVKSYKVDFHIGNNLSLGNLGRIHLFSEEVELTLEMRNRLTFFLVKLQEGEKTYFKTWDKYEGGVFTDGVLRVIGENHIGVTWVNHFDYTEQVDEYDEVIIDTPYMSCNYDLLIDDYYENHVKNS